MSDEPIEPDEVEPAELELEIIPVALAQLELRLGDKIVAMVEDNLTLGRRAYLKQNLEAFFPGHEVLLLDGGTTLGIIAETKP